MTKQKKLEEGGGTFEQDLERLEEIVAALEEGGLPLENSLKQFEEGIALSRRCERRLREAERKIDMLVRAADGQAVEVPFDEDTPDAAPPPAPRKAVAAEAADGDEDGDGGELLF